MFFSDLVNRFHVAQIGLNLTDATPTVAAAVHRQGVVGLIE
jgi:hypothetical protein